MSFTEWISSTLATTFLIGILGFILRHWIAERIKGSIKHEYDKDLEQHKADLKRNYDVQIETLKAEFAKNQHRFSHVFERTAETITTTYKKILELRDNLGADLALAGKKDDESKNRMKEHRKLRIAFYLYLRENKIYLPKETAEKISTFNGKTTSALTAYEAGLNADTTDARYEKLAVAVEPLFNEIPELLSDLEDDFRKVLGLQ
jgi:uncharacterized membrane-anchored protein YhcB (DUF1043 family)